MSEKPTYEELEQRIQELEQAESERKRAEEALRESEAKLLEAQSVAHIGNWAWDLQANKLSWSEENYRIFSLPLEVSPSYETFEKTIHPEDRAFVNKSVEDALKRKKPYNIEFRIILPDDKEGIVHAIGKVDYDKEDKPLRFFGTVQDITERKRAENTLQRCEALLSATQKLTKVGGWEWDVEKQTMFWTDEVYRIHDFQPSEFTPGSTKHIEQSIECYDPEDRPVILEAFRNCAEKGQAYDLEFPFTTAMGRRIWIRTVADPVLKGDRVVRVVGNIMDITERKQTFEAFKAQKEFSEKIIKTSSAIIVGLDKNHKIRIFNKGAEKITGFKSKEVIGNDWLKIFFKSEIYDEMDKVWKDAWGSKFHSYVNPIRTKNGDEKIISWQTSGMYDGADETKHMLISIGEDITARNRAEEALRESEEKYRRLVESTVDWVWSVDIEGRCTFSNQAIRQILGYEVQEVVGEPAFQRMHPGDQERIKEILKRAVERKEGWENLPIRWMHKDGSVRFIESTAQPVLDTNDNLYGFSGIDRDITDRIKAEENLKLINFSINHVKDAMYWMGPDAHFTNVNDAACRALGYMREDLLTMSVHDIGPEFSKEAWPNHWDELRKRGSFMFETTHLRKDGSIFPVEISVNYLKYGDQEYNCAFARDITDRVKAREILKKNEVKYRRLFERSNDAIFVVDKTTGRYLDANTAALKLTGYTLPELKQLTTADVTPEGAKRRLEILATYQQPKSMGEVIYLQPDGTKRIAELDIIQIDDETVYGIARDITDKKRMEDQLQQAQKMESIGTLAGGIAHDFNNILSPIMIHSEMAMMELPSGSPLQQNMKQIYRAGERARDLVKQILTFARRQEEERIPLRVSQILKEAIKLLRSSIPTTIDIQYHINSEQDTALSDPTQINQIIMNLCTNAAHAMEENGGILEVILNNENLDSESADAFPDLEPGHYVKLTVKDTGQGIEPQFMDKIFDPYFTTKEVGKGTGMGLALVHGIVKSYGGAVTVQSEMGKGTSFHVYLPLVEEDMDILETAQDSVELPTGTERILFVDDEKSAVDAIQLMLEKLGYKVTARTSSIEALEAFRNKPQGFDLVITDMTMPNMTGKDLSKELMTIRPGIPIILCTGFSEKIDERRAEEMGIRAFVMKPIVMRDMANTIREVLDPAF